MQSNKLMNYLFGFFLILILDSIMESVLSVLIPMEDLQAWMLEESFNYAYFCFFAGEHQQAHFHSINGGFTLVLAVIGVCSLPIFVEINLYINKSYRYYSKGSSPCSMTAPMSSESSPLSVRDVGSFCLNYWKVTPFLRHWRASR